MYLMRWKSMLIFYNHRNATNCSTKQAIKSLFLGPMFAIIDIETCGGKYEYKRGRITEICIAIHDGLQVI